MERRKICNESLDLALKLCRPRSMKPEDVTEIIDALKRALAAQPTLVGANYYAGVLPTSQRCLRGCRYHHARPIVARGVSARPIQIQPRLPLDSQTRSRSRSRAPSTAKSSTTNCNANTMSIHTHMHAYLRIHIPPPRASSRPHPPILALARRFSSRTSPCLMHVPLPMPRVHAPHPAATAPRQTARAPEPRARAHGVHHALTTRHRAPHIRAWGPSRWWYIIYVVHTRG